MSTRWYIGDIADAVCEAFARQSEQFDREQSVRGLDSLDELAHHGLIQIGLRQAGFGVYPEERYPKDSDRHKRSEGDRCDVVLTANGSRLADAGAVNTLFADVEAVAPTEAFWLEAKIIRQFTEEGPNASYGSELSTRLRADVSKLARDGMIRHGALMLLVYVAEQHVAQHDLQVWERSCCERDLPIGVPSVRWVKVGDRLGHRWMGIAIYPIIRGIAAE